MQDFILKNLINIVFLILMLYGFIKGFSEGFLKKVLSFGSIIVTIIATKYFTPIVSGIVKDLTNIESTLTTIIYDVLINSTAYDKLNLGRFGGMLDTENLAKSIRDGLCANVANALINLVCGIVIFIVVLILLRIALKVLDVIDYIPVVGQFNKLLGGVLGLVEIILITWIVFTVIKGFENVPSVSILIEKIRSSALVSFLYDNNIVYNFFSNLLNAFKNIKI